VLPSDRFGIFPAMVADGATWCRYYLEALIILVRNVGEILFLLLGGPFGV